RYVTACAGRGAYPIKFNGSLFTVSRDFRAWGGQYWFQNTRAMYWPRLMAGDFDMMLPLFNMYAQMLPGNEALVKQYYHHDGAYFQETTPFWGGLPYMGPDVEPKYTNHYFTPILELSMMMLDYFEYTGDTAFARRTLMPIATAGITFFDRHFGRDIMSKLLLDPDNSIEMFWKVHDPAPDIAALKAVLPRMIALPDGLAGTEIRQAWQRLLGELPPLPMGATPDGQPILLPYTGPQTAKSFNEENPELYAVYPYRLYSLQKPELQLAQTTFLHRKFKDKGCWEQDPIQAAMLGYAGTAKEFTSYNLTRKDPGLKFPAFWAKGHDYAPDEDNGGNGENGLQQMLLQTDGRKILLLPAWPQDWNADFKLNAPYRTTIQGKVVNGQLTELIVTPASRMADVTIKSSPSEEGSNTPFEGEKTSWRDGFDRYDYLMDEQTNAITPIKATPEEQYGAKPAEKGKLRCIVIAPKKAAPGNPWSWRGCYWDHEPQTEVELLRRGYHIAFIMCDPDTHWEAWYDFLTEKHGLSRKPAFIGMSRGGINEYAWAATHPDKVSCIYADNPALRPESMAQLEALARHDIPLLHVCGSYDFLLQEHTLKVEDRYHQLGGRISVVIKEGPAHHPHSIRDPALIAGWMEQNTVPEGGTPPVTIPKLSFDKSYYYSYDNTYRYLKEEDIYATCRGPLFTECYDRWDVDNGSDLGIDGWTIIVPKTPAPGKPWVFHADRIGHGTDPVDLALLAKGFYIVAAPVTSQAGPVPEQWEELYQQLTQQGFSKTPVMTGAGSAGGEACHWAITHPDRVSCIYTKDPILRIGRLTDSIPQLILHDPKNPWYKQPAGNIKVFTDTTGIIGSILTAQHKQPNSSPARPKSTSPQSRIQTGLPVDHQTFSTLISPGTRFALTSQNLFYDYKRSRESSR
ncbi:MAG TPA: alpha/beta hydrolase, partial [Puia sp.]|nr:alpha/beta hydrolase [Puia sp.]